MIHWLTSIISGGSSIDVCSSYKLRPYAPLGAMRIDEDDHTNNVKPVYTNQTRNLLVFCLHCASYQVTVI